MGGVTSWGGGWKTTTVVHGDLSEAPKEKENQILFILINTRAF